MEHNHDESTILSSARKQECRKQNLFKQLKQTLHLDHFIWKAQTVVVIIYSIHPSTWINSDYPHKNKNAQGL